MPTDTTLPDHADLMAAAAVVERDVAALAPVLARAWPRSVARVLCLAARAGAVNRRAASLNVALARAGMAYRVATATADIPLAVADPMWRAIIEADAASETAS